MLHEALSQSGDHYSIEYDGHSRSGMIGGHQHMRLLIHNSTTGTMSSAPDDDEETLGQFKRQLPPPQGSPSKRRRHSDTGSLLLTLPNPRGNMKGSLSLEGEPPPPPPPQATGLLDNQKISAASSKPSPPQIYNHGNVNSTLQQHRQPADAVANCSRSPSLSSTSSIFTAAPTKESSAEALFGSANAAEDWSSDSAIGATISAIPKNIEWASSQDSECSSVFSDDQDLIVGDDNQPLLSSDKLVNGPGKNKIIEKSLTRESSVKSEGGDSICSLPDEKAAKRRRMWYKHHHFSTPVNEDHTNHGAVSSNSNNNKLSIRSSSLPDPYTLPLTHVGRCRIPPSHTLLSSHSLHPPPIPCHSPPLPLITVSSPSHTDTPDGDKEDSIRLHDTLLHNEALQNLSNLYDLKTIQGQSKPLDLHKYSDNERSGNIGTTRSDGNELENETVFGLRHSRFNKNNNNNDEDLADVSSSRPSVIHTAVSATSTLSSEDLPQGLTETNCIINGTTSDDSDDTAVKFNNKQPMQCSLSSDAINGLGRTSCLKTARRTATDMLEVVSLDHTKHGL